MRKWLRPRTDGGEFYGINDSSIYTFKENKYESLARETLQNSLDECLDDNKPVIVEYHLFDLNTNDIPGLEKYKGYQEDNILYWKKDSQENAVEFFENAISLLNKKSIKVMRVSDFNTGGVEGSNKRSVKSSADLSAWHKLIKSEGSSTKGGSQGGSFGIGKNATFATSELRTVFYSTYDKEGVKGFEGVTKMASVFKDGHFYSARAYYGIEGESQRTYAIPEILDLDPAFKRSSYGTDIYILGFEDESDFKDRMVVSILSDFMIPIFENKLIVKIAGDEISSETISEVFEKYKNSDEYDRATRTIINRAYEYFKVIESKETVEFETEMEGLGKAKLKVLYNTDYSRRVMRTRERGMRLYEAGHVSSTIGFSGIVRIEGEKLNKLFRKMETPAHDKWSVDNIDNATDKRLAKKLLTELNTWIRHTVINNYISEDLEQIDIAELGNYLPSYDDGKVNEDSEELESEGLDVKIRIEKRKQPTVRKRTRRARNHEKTESAHDGVPGEGEERGKNKSGKGFMGLFSKGEKNENKIPTKVFDFVPRIIRQTDHYILNITSRKSIKNPHIEVFISGETITEKINVLKAQDLDSGEFLKVEENRICINELKKGKKIKLNIWLDSKNVNSLEVELYENK